MLLFGRCCLLWGHQLYMFPVFVSSLPSAGRPKVVHAAVRTSFHNVNIWGFFSGTCCRPMFSTSLMAVPLPVLPWMSHHSMSGHSMSGHSMSGHSMRGPQWVATEWVATQWVGIQWVATQWVDIQWVGIEWVATQWVAIQWVATQWDNIQRGFHFLGNS